MTDEWLLITVVAVSGIAVIAVSALGMLQRRRWMGRFVALVGIAIFGAAAALFAAQFIR